MSQGEDVKQASRRYVAEMLGTAFLLMAVVGSGIMGERLMGGNIGLALLGNTLGTVTVLMVMIFAFGPISGAHFNPAVTLCVALRARLPWRLVPGYMAAQGVGAIVGVWIAHLMFELPVLQISGTARSGAAQGLSEFVATFGLLATIWGVAKLHSLVTPLCVAAYIAGAYWFTASTSFANPVVTLARAFSNTFAGIAPGDVPMFVVAQVVGALVATALFDWLSPEKRDENEIIVPHGADED